MQKVLLIGDEYDGARLPIQQDEEVLALSSHQILPYGSDNPPRKPDIIYRKVLIDGWSEPCVYVADGFDLTDQSIALHLGGRHK
ncbi:MULTISPECIES: hypothetical protein [Pseudomonas chlororaphis group]|uniref:Uncharacterized protein n=1 Tax=Pseudomonas fragi TaxID=296 RepID=A0A9Q5AZ34_PSEFR|nr:MULTISPECIES: hypothetical protein [Pseudomonas chlororaphis group]NNB48904.1 hypothetical protein [Pseudomonas fragi]